MRSKVVSILVIFFMVFVLAGCDLFGSISSVQSTATTTLSDTTTSMTTTSITTTSNTVNTTTTTTKNQVVNFTVAFEENGGSDVATQTISQGNKMTAVTTARLGFTFVGWFTDSALTIPYNVDTPVTNNLTLYAKWTANTITISVHLKDGIEIDFTVPYGTTLGAIENMLDAETLSLLSGWYTDAGLINEMNAQTPLTSSMDLYIEYDDVITVVYNHIETLNIKAYYSDIFLTEEGYIYSEYIDYFIDIENRYYSLLQEENVYVSIPLNVFMNLRVNEVISEVLDYNGYHVVVLTNQGRALIFGMNENNLLTSHFTSDLPYGTTDLADVIALNANETIRSAILSETNVTVSTSEGRVFTWGDFVVNDIDYDIALPKDVSDDFDFDVDEYFVKVYENDEADLNINYTTNKQYYTFVDGIKSFFEGHDFGDAMFVSADIFLETPERVVYFQSDPGYGYALVTESGRLIADMEGESYDVQWDLLDNEIIKTFGSAGHILTSLGNIYELYDLNTIILMNDEFMEEGELATGFYDNGEDFLITTSRNQFYLYNSLSNVTQYINEAGLNIDDLVECGHRTLFIKDGVYYEVYSRSVYAHTFYGFVPTMKMVPIDETMTIESLTNTDLVLGQWIDIDGNTYAPGSSVNTSVVLYPEQGLLDYQVVNVQFPKRTMTFNLVQGTKLNYDDIRYSLDSNIVFEGFTIDGTSMGVEILIDDSLNDKLIIIDYYELPIYSVTVKFVDDKGVYDEAIVSIVENRTLEYSFYAGDYLNDEQKFDGYYLDMDWTEIYDSKSPVTSELIIYAKIIDRPTYTVTFIYEDEIPYTMSFYEDFGLFFYDDDVMEEIIAYFDFSSDIIIEEYYSDEAMTKSINRTYKNENLTVYVKTGYIKTVQLMIYDTAGQLLDEISEEFATKDLLSNLFDDMMYDFFYGYELIQVASDVDFINLIDVNQRYDENVLEFYIQVQELPKVTITLHVLSEGQFTTVVVEAVKGSYTYRLEDAFDDSIEIEIYSEFYLDSDLTVELTSNQFEEDMELYVDGWITRYVTVTVIFDTELPAFTFNHRSNEQLYYWRIANYISENEVYELLSYHVYWDDNYQNEFDGYVMTDMTLYVKYEVREPFTVTFTSIDDLFNDFTLTYDQPIDLYHDNLYYFYLYDIFLGFDMTEVRFFFDEAMMQPFTDLTYFNESLIIYVALIEPYEKIITVHFDGYAVPLQSFVVSNESEFNQWDVFNYVNLVYGYQGDKDYFLYKDVELTMLFYGNETVIPSELYFVTKPIPPTVITYVFTDETIPTFSQTEVGDIYIEDYNVFNHLSNLGFNFSEIDIQFYSDETLEHSIENVSVRGLEITVYVSVTVIEPTMITIHYYGIDMEDKTYEFYNGVDIPNQFFYDLEDYLYPYDLDYDLYLDSELTQPLFGYAYDGITDLYAVISYYGDDDYELTFVHPVYGTFYLYTQEGKTQIVNLDFIEWIKSEFGIDEELVVGGLYEDAGLTTPVQFFTVISDKTYYLEIHEKTSYNLTFNMGEYGTIDVPMSEGDELLAYSLSDFIFNYLELNHEYRFEVFYDSAFTERFNDVLYITDNMTLYVKIIEYIMVDIVYYDIEGYLIDSLGAYILTNKDLTTQIKYQVQNHFEGHYPTEISYVDDFTALITEGTLYDGVQTTIYVNVEEYPIYPVNLHLIDPYTGAETICILDVYETYYVLDEVESNPDFDVYSSLYYDSTMLINANQHRVYESIDVYAEGIIREKITITFIYDTGIEPLVISRYLDDEFYLWEIENDIYFKDGRELTGFDLYLDPEYTIPFDFNVTGSMTVYVSYTVLEAFPLTFVSIDGLFNDFTIFSEFTLDLYSSDVLYSYYLFLIAPQFSSTTFEYYLDFDMTVPFISALINSETTIYVKSSIQDYYTVTVYFTNMSILEQRFIVPTSMSFDWYYIFYYSELTNTLPTDIVGVYTDAEHTIFYDSSLIQSETTLYVTAE